MDQNSFLKLLHNNPDWDNMVQNGSAGIVLNYKGVEFNIYIDNASHYLSFRPQGSADLLIIQEFNELMNACRNTLSAELTKWDKIRLMRDDASKKPIE